MNVFKEENDLLVINAGQSSNVAPLGPSLEKYSLDFLRFKFGNGLVVVQSAPPSCDCAFDSLTFRAASYGR
jgi:hypothetical protein